MLSGSSFYHRIIRKNVIAFGSVFNDITLKRYSYNTFTELERFKVPLSYAPKETFITKLLGDPDLQKNVQTTLPRMSFEITSIAYDSARKLSSFNETFYVKSNSKLDYLRSGVPYTIGFELNVYARNVEDGTQIIEQILPYFEPDYTVSINFIDNIETKRDVPIILNDVSYSQEYEGEKGTVRYLIWTLNFSMKTYFYTGASEGSLIRKTIANTSFELENTALRQFVLENNCVFKLGEVVYQGDNIPTATAIGRVSSQNGNTVTIQVQTGTFVENVVLKGDESGVTCTINQDVNVPLQVVYQSVTPDPIGAASNSDFGFTDVLQEYPYINPVTANTDTYTVDSFVITADTQLLTSDEEQ
jgi:hypothetical protein